jgi:hypothetical protein
MQLTPSSPILARDVVDGPDTMIRARDNDDWCQDFFEIDDSSMSSIPDDDDVSILSSISSISYEHNPIESLSGNTVTQRGLSLPNCMTCVYPPSNSEMKQSLSCLCRKDASRDMSSLRTKESHQNTEVDRFPNVTIVVGFDQAAESSDEQHRASLGPFALLPNEVVSRIFNYLDVTSLVRAIQVSTRFRVVGSLDISGWPRHCEDLWRDKVHVLTRARQLKSDGQSLSAFVTSYHDARLRQEIAESELCYDPVSQSGTVWNFRFKDAAGPAWTTSDPWHSGGDARKLVFLRDGTIAQLVGGSDGTISLVSPFSDEEFRQRFDLGTSAMKWRYILQPMDAPCRPLGAYIRITFLGRDVPTYVVHRASVLLNNWGFIMDSCWGMFSSFPLPRRHNLMRPMRTVSGELGLFSALGRDIDGASEGELAGGVFATLLSDESLPTTSRLQWREALLYNYGAAKLPEGEQAKEEFDRLYSAFHRFSSLQQHD